MKTLCFYTHINFWWANGGRWAKIHHKSIQKAPLGIDQEEQFYLLNNVGTLFS